MRTSRTINEIQRDGLIALRERLGVAGMVRFLQQFEHGSCDYVADRRAWVNQTTFADIRAGLKKFRRSRRRINSGH